MACLAQYLLAQGSNLSANAHEKDKFKLVYTTG